MAKPSQLPRWASDVTAKVTPEPTEGKKSLGWVASEKPPEAYWNWVLKTIYLWCVYLDGLTNEALTWASKHTFSAGLASSVAPAAATDVVRKTELDAEATARAAAISSAVSPKANDSAVVHLTGNETVAGVKTFSSLPSIPATPVAATDAASKGYVDPFRVRWWARVRIDAAGAITILSGNNVTATGSGWTLSALSLATLDGVTPLVVQVSGQPSSDTGQLYRPDMSTAKLLAYKRTNAGAPFDFAAGEVVHIAGYG